MNVPHATLTVRALNAAPAPTAVAAGTGGPAGRDLVVAGGGCVVRL